MRPTERRSGARDLLSQRRPPPSAGIAYQAELNAANVILASSRVRLMTLRVAKPFCEDIGDLARSTGAKGLVMDLDSLATATPRAAVYAMRQLRDMPVSRVALMGGSRLTRRLASVVLTLGRYGDFRFFADCEGAISWAAREGEDSR
ncbi:MAG: hypothetical protein M3O95_07280 [Candidatus Dormibacteraeota bacterium]|nr:hypothetical protein [Candidatus Dormibacteraeota bacterium]